MNKLLTMMPYLVSIATIANTIIQYRTGVRLYAILAVSGICLSVFQLFSNKHRQPTSIITPIMGFYFLWLGIVFLVQMISGSFYDDADLAIKTLFSIAWAPAYWLAFIPCASGFDWGRFARFQVVLGLFVAAGGVAQRFVSLNLFGLLPDVKWHEHFSANMDQYRVTSLLGSPQVFGLYCVVMAVLVATSFPQWRWTLRLTVFAAFCLAALLSGNRSVVLLLMVFAVTRIQIPSKPLVLGAAVTAALLFTASIKDTRSVATKEDRGVSRSLAWVNKIPALIKNERKGRFSVYSKVIDQTNPLFGNGMGCTAPSQGTRGINPESHLLLLYAEAGLPAAILFAICLGILFTTHYRHKNWARVYITGVVLLSSCYVHAFAYPAFFCIWPLILAPAQAATVAKTRVEMRDRSAHSYNRKLSLNT